MKNSTSILAHKQRFNGIPGLALLAMLGLAAWVVGADEPAAPAPPEVTKEALAGTEAKQWDLKKIKMDDSTEQAGDLAQDDEFWKSSVARRVPCGISFHADGACEMTYPARFKDGDIVHEELKLKGKWSVDGRDVKIEQGESADDTEHMIFRVITFADGHLTAMFLLDGTHNGVLEVDYAAAEGK